MTAREKIEKIKQQVENVCWGYEAENGPDIWAQLSPAYRICGLGTQQSPIDIVDPVPAKLPVLTFNYQSIPVNLYNTGNTIQVEAPEGSWVAVDGTKYHLVQFHFHAPSEHKVAGQAYPIEVHLVHKSEAGTLAVIAVFVAAGRINTTYGTFWHALPSVSGESRQIEGVQLDLQGLLPSLRDTYRYTGSLTTPPCSEGVKWFVMTTPVEMSHSQIATFKAILDGNNRPVQPLNGRELVVDTADQSR